MRKAQTARPVKLRKLYEGLLTTSVVHRVETLKKVLQWYDQMFEYLKARRKPFFPLAELAAEEEFLQQRRIGISASNHPDKEKAFRKAIAAAEIMCLPWCTYRIEKAYAELAKYTVELGDVQLKLEDKYHDVIGALHRSLIVPGPIVGPVISIRVIEGDKAVLGVKSAGQLIYNRKSAKALQHALRRKGVLALALQEIKTLSRVAAQEDDGEGNFTVNPEKQLQAVFAMLDNFVRYAQSKDAPKRLVRREEA